MHKRKKMKSQFKWFTLSLLIAMIFGTRMQASGTTKTNLKNEEGNSTCNVLSLKKYTLVTKNGEEFAFNGLTLTQELPANTDFYIKDSDGKIYYGGYHGCEIYAENHKNLSTYYPVEDKTVTEKPMPFNLRKANTWIFTITEPASADETIKLTADIQNPTGEVKYMFSTNYMVESDEVFDADGKITKQLAAGKPFFITRDDDFGLFNLTAAESNAPDGYRYWKFSEDATAVGYIPAKVINAFSVKDADLYTITLDTENKKVTVEAVPTTYTLVAGNDEFAFNGLTLTQELPAQTKFFVKDNKGNEYHGSESTLELIINAEEHENLPTYAEGKNFYFMKANTWVFTLAETSDDLTLTVVPQTKGETKYMITESLDKESEDVFVDNKLTKEMTTKPFFIVRSDDYGIFELTAVERNDQKGYYIWEFGKENNTIGFIIGERRNMYRVEEDGIYTFTLDHDQNTVSSILTSNTAYNESSTAVTSIYSDDNWSIDEDGAWYTIDGRECNGKPTQKGLYIHNGRKVTIN